MEAEKLITMSLGKIATSRCQRGGINLHRNLLVASVLHKARTVYMMDAYQHIISSRKQKKENEETQQIVQEDSEKSVEESQAESRSAMTHAEPISHADNKENSPPLTAAISLDKGSVQQEIQGVDITDNSSESGMQTGVTECKLTTNNSVVNYETSSEKMDSPLRESTVSNANNRPCALTCLTGKRRRSHSGNNESPEISDSIIDSPKKAKLDIPSGEEFNSDEKENVENSSDNFCDENVGCVRDSTVTCKVTKSCDNSEPMQAETTQITTLVTIFNTGFNGLCSRNSNSSDSNLNGQSQNLSCATELIHESVQIPSGIALTV